MKALVELMWCRSYGSVTIDAICEQAGVRKGSFYHFFRSKTDLAAASLEWLWSDLRPELDAVFSASHEPPERLRLFFARARRRAHDLRESFGRVPGCPFFVLGSEVCGVEPEVLAVIRDVLARYHRYLESTIRDGIASGAFEPTDPAAAARALFALFEGALTQARIHDDPERVAEAESAAFRLLAPVGVPA